MKLVGVIVPKTVREAIEVPPCCAVCGKPVLGHVATLVTKYGWLPHGLPCAASVESVSGRPSYPASHAPFFHPLSLDADGGEDVFELPRRPVAVRVYVQGSRGPALWSRDGVPF